MDVSIIIVNYNTKELLTQAIDSIHKNVTRLKYEIVVVDNNSTDRSSDFIKKTFPEVTLIHNEFNAGTSIANNQAAAIAKGRYLLFLNSDTLIMEDALETMTSFLDSEPSAGAVACKLLNEDGSLQRSCGIFPTLATEFCSRSFLSRIFPNNHLLGAYKLASWDYSSASRVDWATSACLMVRAEVFREISGFDENIFMFYDEVDLCMRIRKHGFEIFFTPNAQVFHFHGGTWQHYREIPIFHSCKSSLYFFRKHLPAWQAHVLRLFLLLEIFLSYIFFLPYLVFKDERSKHINSRIRGYNLCLKLIFSGKDK